MSSKPLTTRVTPAVHDRLVELATRRRTSLAATAAGLLSAAVADAEDTPVPLDGALVAAVLDLLGDLTAPRAVLCRETAVHLARVIERRDRGYVAAAETLMSAADKAIKAQQEADQPPGPSDLDVLLNGFGL
ncbi:hypothetical protein PV703_12820 [Streptomyces sp. ME01-24h]|nr:hypothetical protein [Streptomyces sp. ME01-24h]